MKSGSFLFFSIIITGVTTASTFGGSLNYNYASLNLDIANFEESTQVEDSSYDDLSGMSFHGSYEVDENIVIQGDLGFVGATISNTPIRYTDAAIMAVVPLELTTFFHLVPSFGQYYKSFTDCSTERRCEDVNSSSPVLSIEARLTSTTLPLEVNTKGIYPLADEFDPFWNVGVALWSKPNFGIRASYQIESERNVSSLGAVFTYGWQPLF